MTRWRLIIPNPLAALSIRGNQWWKGISSYLSPLSAWPTSERSTSFQSRSNALIHGLLAGITPGIGKTWCLAFTRCGWLKADKMTVIGQQY